jgi:hypothetical protein
LLKLTHRLSGVAGKLYAQVFMCFFLFYGTTFFVFGQEIKLGQMGYFNYYLNRYEQNIREFTIAETSIILDGFFMLHDDSEYILTDGTSTNTVRSISSETDNGNVHFSSTGFLTNGPIYIFDENSALEYFKTTTLTRSQVVQFVEGLKKFPQPPHKVFIYIPKQQISPH